MPTQNLIPETVKEHTDGSHKAAEYVEKFMKLVDFSKTASTVEVATISPKDVKLVVKNIVWGKVTVKMTVFYQIFKRPQEAFFLDGKLIYKGWIGKERQDVINIYNAYFTLQQ